MPLWGYILCKTTVPHQELGLGIACILLARVRPGRIFVCILIILEASGSDFWKLHSNMSWIFFWRKEFFPPVSWKNKLQITTMIMLWSCCVSSMIFYVAAAHAPLKLAVAVEFYALQATRERSCLLLSSLACSDMIFPIISYIFILFPL